MSTAAERSPRAPLRRLARSRVAVTSGVVLVALAIVAALFGPISRHGTRFTLSENHLCMRNMPPGARGVPRHYARLVPGGAATFARTDVDGSGGVDAAELSGAVREIEFAHLDDGDGAISVAELARMPRTLLSVDIAGLHRTLDADRSGGLSAGEAARFTDIFPVSEAGQFVRRDDADGDGVLGPSEFRGVPQPEVFLLGTDALGRDLATRMVYGARVSLLVGLLATLVAMAIGVTWGGVAGFVGGRVDALMMRVVDVIYGLPFMFLVILLMVVFGRHFVLLFVAIGAVSWLTMSRIVRGQVIALKQQDFVQAARALGVSGAGILFRHILPNTLGPIIVYATLTVPAVMLEEAFLSFIGLGVQAPFTSWGALASEGASPAAMRHYPWLIVAPGIALATTLLALNFLGDGVRDAFDPRLNRDV